MVRNRVAVPANINSVRGVACMLVVALHVVGDSETMGLRLPMTSNWHYVMTSIEFLRIPLFTALSGYLYAGNRVTREGLTTFWQKKLRRLGAPLVFVTFVIWFLRGRVYSDPTSLPHALLFSFEHLWYVQALIILFAVISIADGFYRPGFGALVLAGLAAVMISQSDANVTTCFSLNGALYLAPHFLFGILLREQPEWLRDRRAGTLALGIVTIVLTAQQFGLYGVTKDITILQLPAAVAGMAGIVFLLQRMPPNAMLAAVGTYSYTIYLWHVVANSAVRGVLIRAGITNLPLLFSSCFITALIAPIVLYYCARRIPILSVAVTGEKCLSAVRKPRRNALRSQPGAPMVADA
jgi:peptidoglycan/LPS O-acetylase OafA/YrhL